MNDKTREIVAKLEERRRLAREYDSKRVNRVVKELQQRRERARLLAAGGSQ